MSTIKEEQAICVRNTRLNNLILGNIDAKANASKSLTGALSREALLDTLTVLYTECDKDGVKKRDQNVSDFVTKCEYMMEHFIERVDIMAARSMNGGLRGYDV